MVSSLGSNFYKKKWLEIGVVNVSLVVLHREDLILEVNCDWKILFSFWAQRRRTVPSGCYGQYLKIAVSVRVLFAACGVVVAWVRVGY